MKCCARGWVQTANGYFAVQSNSKNCAACVREFMGTTGVSLISICDKATWTTIFFARQPNGTWLIDHCNSGIARNADEIVAAFHARVAPVV